MKHETRAGDLAQRLLAGDRAALARAITLVESKRADHEDEAQALLQAVLPATGRAVRLGITGVPGAGKSTLVDQLGVNLTGAGHRVAVLAVDPTSQRTGGSILGDKTRMARLSVDPNAFIRPSPAGTTLGGVARRTRETMLLCEAAGFDVVIVETVGIGQSETAVASMVDFFCVLMVPGTGDDLQGIKKGVLEIADMIAVNKADGENEGRARHAAADYRAALSILTPVDPEWQPPVILVSGLKNLGLDHLWAEVLRHRGLMMDAGKLEARRQEQQVEWMWSLLEDRLKAKLRADPRLRDRLAAIENEVRRATLTPTLAVKEILGRIGL
ncbi:MAG: methylmalonyl Co-A mutase-associated GTPase MeaB [Hyphomicrobiales bacterium]